MRLIRSIAHNWQEGGAKRIMRKTVRRTVGVIHNAIDFLVYRLDDLDVEVPRSEGGRFAELSLEALLDAGFTKATTYPAEMERRLREGETCLGIFYGDDLGHVSWMIPDALPIDRGIDPVPVEGAVGIYDMFTLPAFRGRGAQTAALAELCRRAHQRGFDRALAGIYENNAPSRHVFGKIGFRSVGTLRYRRTLWMERVDTPDLS